MAETKTDPKNKADAPAADAVGGALAETPKAEKAPSDGPPMVMRALLGFSGLSLLVGFGLEWIRIPERITDGTTTVPAHWVSGVGLLTEGALGGMPAPVLLAVPILGIVLSAAAFMGFRFSAHAAIGIASTLLLYGLWVVLRLFVEHTRLGLWVTVGGMFVTLLLGVITLMWGRERGHRASAKEAAPAPTSGT